MQLESSLGATVAAAIGLGRKARQLSTLPSIATREALLILSFTLEFAALALP